MFDHFDTQITPEETQEAREYEAKMELKKKKVKEIRESLQGHLASEGIEFEDYCGGYEDCDPNPYHGTYSEM
jgi:hypothetical protein|tara:strand:- start:1686 stop:1901 length:216 start_codon:yes stop_codon:yes gene_type:complete